MTILGLHTAHELSDLLAAKQSNIADLSTAVDSATANVDTTGPAWSGWLQRYSTFLNGWNPVASNSQTLIEADQASLTGWDFSTEEAAYNALLAAVAPLAQLITDFAAIPGNPQARYTAKPTPQPTAPDADLSTLTTINTIPVVKSGGLIDETVAEVSKLTAPGTGTYWLVGGAVVGTLAAIFLVKRAL